ncbi:hypothetical protein C1646_754499 [Rhizophagus diaphanus]|nr:hypothetical protein C1646_754499 [Rhizophagus diaphanus] [Rhizophagus sp. MUCL 43196]
MVEFIHVTPGLSCGVDQLNSTDTNSSKERKTADGIKDDAQTNDKTIPCNEISAGAPGQNSSIVPLLSLAKLFDKATDAEYVTIRANWEEILRYEKKAKGIIYDKLLKHFSILRKKRSENTGLQLPQISCKYLQGKTQKAVKIYVLFEKLGIDKIKYITTYSANSLSELTNEQMQNIIKDATLKTITIANNRTNATPKAVSWENDQSQVPLKTTDSIHFVDKAQNTTSPKNEVSAVIKKVSASNLSSDPHTSRDIPAFTSIPVTMRESNRWKGDILSSDSSSDSSSETETEGCTDSESEYHDYDAAEFYIKSFM